VREAIVRALPAAFASRVDEAADGAAALAACARDLPDIIFLDLGMPVLDGYAVLKALQPLPRGPRIIVVSSEIAGGAAAIRALGASYVLGKPWRPGEIELALRSIGVL